MAIGRFIVVLECNRPRLHYVHGICIARLTTSAPARLPAPTDIGIHSLY